MDFRPDTSEIGILAEVKALLEENAALWANEPGRTEDEEWQVGLEVNALLARTGWIAPAWPTEYGGRGLKCVEQALVKEQFELAGVPDAGRVQGVGLAGPTIMARGDAAQREIHLPRITNADVVWCQGFSEPGAGSDLAALSTGARRDGDVYVIDGQKIWTSRAHRSDWMTLLARTDPSAPKHKGITFLLMSMDTPGLTVRPLVDMAGRHHFNEVFFDNVQVPVVNRIGEENEGWYVATATLDFERSAISATAQSQRALIERLLAIRSELVRPSPTIRTALAERYIECVVGRGLSLHVAALQDEGKVPNKEASAAKLFASELNRRVASTVLESRGMAGQAQRGRLTEASGFLVSVSKTIAGGTSEIQRSVIATRGLGLPRG